MDGARKSAVVGYMPLPVFGSHCSRASTCICCDLIFLLVQQRGLSVVENSLTVACVRALGGSASPLSAEIRRIKLGLHTLLANCRHISCRLHWGILVINMYLSTVVACINHLQECNYSNPETCFFVIRCLKQAISFVLDTRATSFGHINALLRSCLCLLALPPSLRTLGDVSLGIHRGFVNTATRRFTLALVDPIDPF